MDNQKTQITKQGLKHLQEEFEGLKNLKRPALVERLANARAEGDLKENSDYQNAKDELGFLDGRIEELEKVIDSAEVIDGKTSGGGVSVGTKVKVMTNGTQNTFHIVGEYEADPAEKKISHTSPLGKALLGKKVGDTVEFEVPAGVVKYKILGIK